MRSTKMITLKAGSVVSVCKVDSDKKWSKHVMRKTLTFENEYKTRDTYGSSGAVIYRHGDWLILTRRAGPLVS